MIHASFAYTILAFCAEVRWLACGNILIPKDENGHFFVTMISAIDNTSDRKWLAFRCYSTDVFEEWDDLVSLFKVIILIS